MALFIEPAELRLQRRPTEDAVTPPADLVSGPDRVIHPAGAFGVWGSGWFRVAAGLADVRGEDPPAV